MHRLGDEGEEALCAVAEDVVDLMRHGEEFLVALAGGGVVGGEAFGSARRSTRCPKHSWRS